MNHKAINNHATSNSHNQTQQTQFMWIFWAGFKGFYSKVVHQHAHQSSNKFQVESFTQHGNGNGDIMQQK